MADQNASCKDCFKVCHVYMHPVKAEVRFLSKAERCSSKLKNTCVSKTCHLQNRYFDRQISFVRLAKVIWNIKQHLIRRMSSVQRPNPAQLSLGGRRASPRVGLAPGWAAQQPLFIVCHCAALSHVASTPEWDNKYLPPSHRWGKA